MDGKTSPPEKSPDSSRVPLPPAEDLGNGWWRRRWTVRTAPADPPRELRVPPPLPPLEEVALGLQVPMALTITAVAPGLILVETFGRQEVMVAGELGYLSLVLQAISRLYSEITVNEHPDHPILLLAGQSERPGG